LKNFETFSLNRQKISFPSQFEKQPQAVERQVLLAAGYMHAAECSKLVRWQSVSTGLYLLLMKFLRFYVEAEKRKETSNFSQFFSYPM
jgi:hypothetical protein